jgi:hypothetical protein
MTSRLLDHVNVSNTITDVILVSTHHVCTRICTQERHLDYYTDSRNHRCATTCYLYRYATTKERNNDNIVVIMDTNQHPNYHVACFLFYCYFKDTMLRAQNVATKSHEASLEMAAHVTQCALAWVDGKIKMETPYQERQQNRL